MSDSRYRPRIHPGRFWASWEEGGIAPRRALLDRAAARDLDAARRLLPVGVARPVRQPVPAQATAYVDGRLIRL
jgi:hypothetical protein